MKKYIPIFILLVAVSLLGLSCKKSTPQKEITSRAVQQDNAEEAIITDDKDVKEKGVYKNDKYGFEIELPETWKTVKMSESNWPTYSAICFSFDRYCVTQISIRTQEQYDQNIIDSGDSAPQYDFKNDRYYYRYAYSPDCVELNEFECEREKEVPEIMKTFKFIE